MKLLQEFESHINSSFHFLKDKKLLLACSGGLDSMVLANLLAALSFEISLAHCNFSLRGKESDNDELFVIGKAKEMGIPVFAETFDTLRYAKSQGISTQMAARELRYSWFSRLLEDFKYDYILTAHHLDDDLETFFINLSRGTGIKGLSGIPALNEKIVRPLLNFSRKEIRQYALDNNLTWREDSSNLNDDYLRNNIRHNIIPPLKENIPSFLGNFRKSRNHLQAAQRLLEDYLVLVYNLVVSEQGQNSHIDISALRGLPNYEDLLFGLLSPYGFTSWEDVKNLLKAETGKRIFSRSHELLKNRSELILSEINNDSKVAYEVSEEGITIPIFLKIEKVDFIDEAEKNVIFVDKEKLSFPLVLKHWEEGEEFHPFGMKGKKKISKYFKDEKLSLVEKRNTWILYNGNDIVWVVGRRMDDRFKVTSSTETILKITFIEDIDNGQ